MVDAIRECATDSHLMTNDRTPSVAENYRDSETAHRAADILASLLPPR
jgi:hypothetical protein